MKPSRLILLGLFISVVGPSPVRAMKPQAPSVQDSFEAPTTLQAWWATQEPHRFSMRQWSRKDGLPQNSVSCMTQTRDGYLWLGTFGGLVRFNGVQFEVFDPANTPQLGSNRICSLFEDSTGALWIGTTQKFTRYKDGRFENIEDIAEPGSLSSGDLLRPQRVNAFIETPEGSIWIAGSSGLTQFKDGRFNRYTKDDGLPANYVGSLATTPDGALWIGTKNGLAVHRQGRIETFPSLPVVADRSITTMYFDEEDSLWMGGVGWVVRLIDDQVVFSRGEEDGIQGMITYISRLDENRLIFGGKQLWYLDRDDLNDDQAMPISTISFPIPMDYRSWYQDREGTLWLGTDTLGVFQFRRTNYLHLDASSGIVRGTPQIIISDGQDGLVARNAQGQVARIPGTRSRVNEFSIPPSVGKGWDSHLGSDGSFLVFSGAAISLWKDARWSSLEWDVERDGKIKSVHLDEDGTLWILTRDGLWLRHDGHDDAFHPFPKSLSVVGKTTIQALDASGTLWISTDDHVLRFRDGRFEAITHEDGLPHGQIRGIHVDDDGQAWVTSYGGGLCRIKNGSLFTFSTQNGLLSNSLSRLLEDEAGDFWINSNRGVLRLSRHELNAFADGLHDEYICHRLPTAEANGGTGFKSEDGKLWFPVFGGVVGIDPVAYESNEIPPLVQVNDLVVNGTPYAPEAPLIIPSGRRDLTIRYDGLSFVDPELVHFKYQLVGYDENWQDAGIDREVHYTNLPPGPYEFRVMARNSHGVWSDPTSGLTMIFEPYFHETKLFQASVMLGLLILVAMGWRLRIRRLHRNYEAVRIESDERKQAQFELQSSEERFALSMAGSHDGYWDWNIIDRSIWYSDRLKELLGYDLHEALPPTIDWFNEILYPADEAVSLKAQKRHLEERIPYDLEYRLRTKNGEYRWFRARGQAIWDHEGVAVRMAGSIEDIAARKEAEETLANVARGYSMNTDAQFFESLASHMAQALEADFAIIGELQSGEPMRIQTIAARAGGEIIENFEYDLSGTPCQNVTDQTQCAYSNGIQNRFPEDAMLADMQVEAYVGTPLIDSNGKVIGLMAVLFRHELADTKKAETLLRIYAIRAQAEMERMHAANSLRESEHRTRTILETALDAIVTLDGQGLIIGWNPRAEEIFGWSVQDAMGQDLAELIFPPDHRQAHREGIRQYITTGASSYMNVMQELTAHRCDGSFLPVEVAITPFETTRGVMFSGFLRDITQRKRTEEQLRTSEYRHRTLVEYSPYCIHELDLQGRFISMNPAGLRMMEVQNECDIQEFPYLDIVSVQDRERIATLLERACRGEFSEFDFRGTNNRQFQSSFVPIHDGEGVITHLMGLSLDITERKEAEAALRQSEALLMASIENSPAGIIIVDAPDRRIRIANSAALRIVGQTTTLLQDIPVHEYSTIWTSLHADGTEYTFEELPLTRAIREGEICESEEMIIRRDGAEDHWILINAAPVRNREGEIIAGIAVFPDITERKRSQIRQKIMMDELDHRVKNNLAAVLGLLDQTVKDADSLQDFSSMFSSRIFTISQTHELLARQNWEGVDLAELLKSVLDTAKLAGQYHAEGKSVLIPGRAATSIAFALHELAHLSAPTSRGAKPDCHIEVKWDQDPAHKVYFEWTQRKSLPDRESNWYNPSISLIKGFVEYELSGQVEIEFGEEVFQCKLAIPLDPLMTKINKGIPRL
ncbi:MAG: PAS domain S-box protein [Planctomycetota bacterium]|nr:PAS domain S-box protein [Planctomycetota bacterium]